jgi:lipoprotein-anchoring transpeptidase ErfK/SrfK
MAISKRNKRIVCIVLAAAIVGGVFVLARSGRQMPAASVSAPARPVTKPAATTQTPAVAAPSVQGTMYHTLTIATASPAKELAAAVGASNVQTVLEINRIDTANIAKGRVLIVPNSFDDPAALSPFPATVAAAADIPKLMVVDQAIQAFAVYNNGALMRWGGVNTGKQSTPTPNQLYFANWKGKSVISSEDDSWILPWYVNLDNKEGISMHQYDLPGYPASHSCVRMFEQDAEWIYNWAEQWKVSDDGQTVLQYGTPVIVFGNYAFGKTSPWKSLAKDPAATTVSQDTLETLISSDKAEIVAHRPL